VNAVLTRPSPAWAKSLSAELRESRDPHVVRRRRVVGLSLTAIGALGVVALAQVGVLRRLPDPPLRFFASDTVTRSGSAYWMFGGPDAVVGIGSYAASALLASIGGADRWRRHPWLPLLFAGKLALDAAGAALLVREEVVTQRRACSWCLIASAAAMLSFPQALPEAWAAGRQLLVRGRK